MKVRLPLIIHYFCTLQRKTDCNSKPTWAAISREGLSQYSVTCDTLGIFARSAEDLELICSAFQLTDDEPVPARPFSLKGAKVAFCRSPVWAKAGTGTRVAWEKAQELLKEQNATVADLELPEDFASIRSWHSTVLAAEERTSFLGSEDPMSLLYNLTS